MSRKSAPWEVWLADLELVVGSEQGRKRPVVIVSSPLFAAFPTAMALVVPLSSVHRGLLHHVPVSSPESGLDRVSWARVDDVRAISERRLGRRLGAVSEKETADIRRQLRRMIDI